MNNRSRQLKRIKRLGLTNVIDFKIFDSATGTFKPFRSSITAIGVNFDDAMRNKNNRYYSREAMVKALSSMSKELHEPIVTCEAGHSPSGVWFL